MESFQVGNNQINGIEVNSPNPNEMEFLIVTLEDKILMVSKNGDVISGNTFTNNVGKFDALKISKYTDGPYPQVIFGTSYGIVEMSTSCANCFLADVQTFAPCVGLDNGAIGIQIFGNDTIPINYSWERLEDGLQGNGTSNEQVFSLDDLGAGTYNIYLSTDASEETYVEGVILEDIEGSLLEVTEVITNNSINGLANGSMELFWSGNAAPFTVSWTGPQTGSMTGINSLNYLIENLSVGTYQISIRDANNQVKVLNVTLQDDEITTLGCTEPMDIIILNLVSSAISSQEYGNSKPYFHQFFENLNLGNGADESRVAVAEWAGRTEQDIKIPITGSLNELSEYQNMSRSYTGGTDILYALRFGYEYLRDNARPNAVQVIIFTYDGCPGFSGAWYAEELKEKGIIIADIGIDYVFNSTSYKTILRNAATNDDMAYFARDFDTLDPLQLYVDLTFANCTGSSSTVNFLRDGSLDIHDDIEIDCNELGFVEITFTVTANEQLALPAGMPISFYHNDPTAFGASFITDFLIPCFIPAGESETFTISLPIETASHIYAVLNDDGATLPSFQLPVTDIEESLYSNNIDDIRICTDVEATVQALKSAVSLYPICEDIVQFNINVCNISQIDATDVVIEDQSPEGFVLVETVVNTNNCSTDNGNSFDIPGGCCVSLTLSYDVSAAEPGYYGDQDVLLSGPSGQTYIDFDGNLTSAEDVILDGTEDCGTPVVTFEKAVNYATSCVDHSLTYTFTIDNQSSTPLYGVQFTDVLPSPLEWVYRPYDMDGLSINIDDFLEGQTASFVIDVIEAETAASFTIDANVGFTDVQVTANNIARIEGFPDYINGGIDFLESNTTTTLILGDIEILSIDTIIISSADEVVDLNAVITPAANIEWTSSGDGLFSDSSVADPTYTLGAEDKLDTLIGLFIGVETYCGEKGKSVFIRRESCATEVVLGSDIEIDCNQEEVLLDGSASSHGAEITYAWFDADGNLLGTEDQYETDMPGIYTFQVSDLNADCTVSKEIHVTDVRNVPVASINSTEQILSCENTSIELAADFLPHEIVSWEHTAADVTTVANQLIVQEAGRIILEVKDTITGCINTDEILIEIDTVVPTINLLEPALLNCETTIASIDATGSDPGEFVWLDSNYNELSEDNRILSTMETGIFYFRMLNEDNGCFAIDSIEVMADYSVPEIDMAEAIALSCEENERTLSAIIDSDNAYDLSWSKDQSVIGNELELLVTEPGMYVLELKDRVSACSSSDTIEVLPAKEIESVLYTFNNLSCHADSSGRIEILSVEGGTPEYLYYLNDEITDVLVVENLSAGSYKLEVEDANGCKFDTTVMLTEPLEILGLDNLEELIVNQGRDVEISVITNIPESQISEVIWSPNINCDNCLNYIVENVLEDQSFQVTIIDNNGCSETLEVRLVVNKEAPDIYLPNVIALNNTDGNGVFFPQTFDDNLMIQDLSIYDRWGNLIFNNQNFLVNDPASGWNGSAMKGHAEVGVYVYSIIYQNDNQSINLIGDVTLIK